MAKFVANKQYKDGEVLTEAILDTFRLSIEDWFNKTGLTNENFTDEGLVAADFASGNAQTAGIKNNDITSAKLAALGQQLSSSSSNFSTSNTSYTDVTNLSVSITTTGPPVGIQLVSDGSANSSFIGNDGAAVDDFDIKFLRDSTDVTIFNPSGAGTAASTIHIPPHAFFTVDNAPAAATYTYKVQIKSGAGSLAAKVEYVKLLVWEF